MICLLCFGKKGGNEMPKLKAFDYWCYKVLPLVYDDSLSYYEVLNKVVERLNKIVEEDTDFADDINKLREDLGIVQQWIADFDTSYAEKIIADYIATMIFIEISDAGYFIYHIPETWNDITFNTTELDIHITDTEYGRLVLSY